MQGAVPSHDGYIDDSVATSGRGGQDCVVDCDVGEFAGAASEPGSDGFAAGSVGGSATGVEIAHVPGELVEAILPPLRPDVDLGHQQTGIPSVGGLGLVDLDGYRGDGEIEFASEGGVRRGLHPGTFGSRAARQTIRTEKPALQAANGARPEAEKMRGAKARPGAARKRPACPMVQHPGSMSSADPILSDTEFVAGVWDHPPGSHVVLKVLNAPARIPVHEEYDKPIRSVQAVFFKKGVLDCAVRRKKRQVVVATCVLFRIVSRSPPAL